MFSTFDVRNLSTPLETKKVHIGVPSEETLRESVAGLSLRSRYGCLTCRKRKKKCDEQKPVCGLCLKKNDACVWRTPGTERRNKRLREHEKRPQAVSPNLNNDLMGTPLEVQNLHVYGQVDEMEVEPEYLLALSPSLDSVKTLWCGEKSGTRDLIRSQDLVLSLIRSPQSWSLEVQEETGVQEQSKVLGKKLDYDRMFKLFEMEHSPSRLPSAAQFVDFCAEYIRSPPVPVPLNNLLIEDLDDEGIYYLDYYRTCVATTVSLAPVESNYFLKFYLPLASSEKSVLYSLIGWGGTFLKGSKDNSAYSHYIKKSVEFYKKKLAQKNISKNDILVLLATLSILSSLEICLGDVREWHIFFQEIFKIMQGYGLKKLVQDFNHSNELRWLVLCFLYHDVLSSSSTRNGTCFKPEEYKLLLQQELDESPFPCDDLLLKLTEEDYGADPLQGCVKPLFMLICELINVAVELKKQREQFERLDEEISGLLASGNDEDRAVQLLTGLSQQKFEFHQRVEHEFQLLEAKIIKARPNEIALSYVNDDQELELHLTLFESYQLTLQMYLRMLVLNKLPNTPEMQQFLFHGTNCLEILIGSKLQLSLCLPLLVAGLQCVTKTDRLMMLRRLNGIVANFPVMNFKLTSDIVQEAWRENPLGERCVDWTKITDKFGWDLCVS